MRKMREKKTNKKMKDENKKINLNEKHNRLLNNFRFIFRVSIKKTEDGKRRKKK